MMINYFIPLAILAVTYARVGCELWGSRYIGEYNKQQAENVRSKRRVRSVTLRFTLGFSLGIFT